MGLDKEDWPGLNAATSRHAGEFISLALSLGPLLIRDKLICHVISIKDHRGQNPSMPTIFDCPPAVRNEWGLWSTHVGKLETTMMVADQSAQCRVVR